MYTHRFNGHFSVIMRTIYFNITQFFAILSTLMCFVDVSAGSRAVKLTMLLVCLLVTAAVM